MNCLRLVLPFITLFALCIGGPSHGVQLTASWTAVIAGTGLGGYGSTPEDAAANAAASVNSVACAIVAKAPYYTHPPGTLAFSIQGNGAPSPPCSAQGWGGVFTGANYIRFNAAADCNATGTCGPNPEKGRNPPPPCPPIGEFVGNPICVTNGNKVQVEVDYVDPSSAGLSFERRYSSSGGLGSALGSNWRGRFDRDLTVLTVTTVHLRRQDGTAYYFVLAGGVWTSDSDISHRLVSLPNSAGWELTDASNDSVETYSVAGKLLSIRDRSGRLLEMAYSTGASSVAPWAGLLLSVTSSLGRALTFEYDSSGRLLKVNLPGAVALQYAYDATAGGQTYQANNVTSVTYQDGKGRIYKYNESAYTAGQSRPAHLTGIVDE